MGEAKRRSDARYSAKPYRPPRVCPNCKSIGIERKTLPGINGLMTDYDMCRECATVWEAYPINWCEDVVGAEPCDNCAFRPGSPEQSDPAAWKELVAKLRSGNEFKCHKGAPIEGLDAGKPEFDEQWIRDRGRLCAGFMHMVWAMREKGESWFENRMAMLSSPAKEPSE